MTTFLDGKNHKILIIDQISGPLPWAKIDGNKEHRKILEYKVFVCPEKKRFQEEIAATNSTRRTSTKILRVNSVPIRRNHGQNRWIQVREGKNQKI